MRIAFLNPSGHLGGAERSLLDIFSSIRSSYPEVELHLIASAHGLLVARAATLGVHTHVLAFPPALAALGDAGIRGPAGDRVGRAELLWRIGRAMPGIGRYMLRLRGILRRIAPDVVHTNGFKMHVLGVWAAPIGMPVIWHIHDYVSPRPIMSRLLRWHAGRCRAMIANSDSVARDIKRMCGPTTPVHRVYNAVDLDTFSPGGPRLDLDDLAGLPPAPRGTVRVGLVATLGRWKGHAVFIRAMAALPGDLDLRGYVVGGALYQTGGSQYSLEDLKRLAAELGVADRVGFTGFVDDPASAMRALDVVVHASTQPEPFGLVIAEAMATGRALIASEAGGSAELFSSGLDALGYAPGRVEELAAAIERVARDAELRRALERAGRDTAEKRFNRDRLADELVPVYRWAARGR